MGSQPPLPHPHKDRRPISNPLPGAHLTTPPSPPPLLLSHSKLSLDPTRRIPPALLVPYTWQSQRHRRLGNPPKSIPTRPSRRLHRTPPIRLSQRTIPHPRHTQAHIDRRYSGGSRWEIRRYTARRCSYLLRKSARRLIRQPMHVLLLLTQFDWPPESELRRRILGPVYHRHTLYDSPTAVYHGVL
jgi:hypothetical protein